MSKERLFGIGEPVSFPKQPEPKKKKRHPVQRTRRGVVIYKRKRHFFSTKDLARILQHILGYDAGIPESSFRSAEEFSSILVMLLGIYLKHQTDAVRKAAIDLVQLVLSFVNSGVIPEVSVKQKEE